MKKKALPVLIIIYSVLLALLIADYYLKLSPLPAEYAVLILFAAAAVPAVIAAASNIERFKYSPFILIAVFILSGRLLGFTADRMFRHITGFPAYRLPFGEPGIYLYYLLFTGLSRYFVKTGIWKPDKKKDARRMLPYTLLAVPAVLHFFNNADWITSGFALLLVFIIARAMSVSISPAKDAKYFSWYTCTVSASGLIDMTCFLDNTAISVYFPPLLNYMLLPFVIIYFTCSIFVFNEEKLI